MWPYIWKGVVLLIGLSVMKEIWRCLPESLRVWFGIAISRLITSAIETLQSVPRYSRNAWPPAQTALCLLTYVTLWLLYGPVIYGLPWIASLFANSRYQQANPPTDKTEPAKRSSGDSIDLGGIAWEPIEVTGSRQPRCTGVKGDGTQCTRHAKDRDPTGYWRCWQHPA